MHTPAIDYGTEQRHRHGLVQRAPGPDPDRPGGTDVMRFQEAHEALIDRLKNFLGRDPKIRQTRYDAALWLRECHHNAGRTPRQSMRFELGDGGTNDLTGAQVRCGREYDAAMRAMGIFGDRVQAIVVHDSLIRPGHLEPAIQILTSGLDRLAKHRGIGERRS